MSVATRRLITILLLILGVQLWLLVGRSYWGSNLQLKSFVVIFAASALPWFHRPIARLLDRLRNVSVRTRTVIALAIIPLAFTYLFYTAHRQQRMLFPHTHDERMYLLQARMLATGKLWMQAHPAGDSFETFYVFVRPVYAAMYFPGTALLYAPGLWLPVPLVVLPLLAASAIVALTYRIMTELIDGVAGLLAAMLMMSLSQFRYLSTMWMSHSVMLLMGLCMTWAWLNWRKRHDLRWAAALGAFAAWGAITRPLEALCFAIPIGVAMLIDLRPMPWRRRMQSVATILAAAAPFLAMQIALNIAVTGSPLQTPVSAYNRADAPGVAYGFAAPSLDARPRSSLLQKQVLYDDMVIPAIEAHAKPMTEQWIKSKLPWLATHATPAMLLLIFLPAGFAAARAIHLPLIAVLPLFLLAYLGFPWLLAHYTIIVTPTIILLILLGVVALTNLIPRWRNFISTASTLSLAMLAVTSLPEMNRLTLDEWWVHFPVLKFDQTRLPNLIEKPAIVLYQFKLGESAYDEPVYNTDTAWPDDAGIIRAHDLSAEQNRRLIEHYAKVQPDRRVYRIDRHALLTAPDYQPEFLGTAKALADRYHSGEP